MLLPFQRILSCERQGSKALNAVLVASGPVIYAFNAPDGKFLSLWSHIEDAKLDTIPLNYGNGTSDGANEPPAKKAKLMAADISDASSAEIVTESGTKRRRKPKPKTDKEPAVTNLCSTSDGRHIVAVTGEDKCLRVLTLSEDGILSQLSQRVMPKRPNSVRLTTDGETILCGDKFGDVYALPLMEKETLSAARTEGSDDGASSSAKHAPKPFTPSASSSTVHTKGNREALKQQQSLPQNRAEKKESFYEDLLVLGHVSLLTDLLHVTLPNGSNSRSYIITSDRDEHIRVSRGLPQAHIIEGFCLGHTQFVSSLFVPEWRPGMLISGGGDDFLLVWNWREGRILQQLHLRFHIDNLARELASNREELPSNTIEVPSSSIDGKDRIAVSGIWGISTSEGEGKVLVACEGFPAIVAYDINASGLVTYCQTIHTGSNILDVAFDRSSGGVFAIAVLDNFHEPASTERLLKERGHKYLTGFRYNSTLLEWVEEQETPFLTTVNSWAVAQQSIDGPSRTKLSVLGPMLYGIEHLRKRPEADLE